MTNIQTTRQPSPKFSDLVGKILSDVKVNRDEIVFTVDETESYIMYHGQDCCELVYIEDICGDPQSLVGAPVAYADESSSEDDSDLLWTFYRIGTFKGSLVIRWCANLDTYYSVEVSFERRK
jgi:hypothetical protein